MKLQYTGTAAAEAFPAIFCQCDTCRRAREAGGKDLRFRSGAILNDTVMIDFAPDVCTFAQREGFDLSKVRDVFITHSHHDHFDVEDICMRRNPCFCVLEDERPMNVFCNQAGLDRLTAYAKGDDAIEGYLNVTVLEYFKPYQAENGLTFTYLPANHAWSEKAGFYVIEDGEKTAVYAHDTGVFPEESMAFLKTKSIDFISLDCCYGPRSNRNGHMGIPENREMVKELRDAGALKPDATVVIHHFSHNCGMIHAELEAEVKADGFLVSYDGMTVEI